MILSIHKSNGTLKTVQKNAIIESICNAMMSAIKTGYLKLLLLLYLSINNTSLNIDSNIIQNKSKMSQSKLGKFAKQQDITWSKLHRILINIPFEF